MKKNRVQSSLLLYVKIFIMSSTGFFGFYTYLPWGRTIYSTTYYNILMFITDVLFFLMIVFKKRRVKIKGIFLNQTLLFMMLIAAEIVSTQIITKQAILLTFEEVFFYIIPFFSYITLEQFDEFEHLQLLDSILDIIVFFSFVCSLVALIAFVLYSSSGINILRLTITNNMFRHGTIRFTVGNNVVIIGLLISFIRVLKKQNKNIDIINIGLSLFHIIFIWKTRAMILYVFAVILYSIITEKKTNKLVKVILWTLIIISIFYSLLFTESVEENVLFYINSNAGILIRLEAISFYLEQFLSHPLLGMGFISNNRSLPTSSLLFGDNGMYNRSDVGIIGLMNFMGIAGLIWCFLFVKKVLYYCKYDNNLYTRIIKIIIVYLLISLASLSFMDQGRCIFIFFVYMIVEAYTKKRSFNG